MLLFGALNPTAPSLPRREPRHAVFGIATKGAQVACVAVHDGLRAYFDLPGGGVKSRETEEEAIVREFAEEAGLRVKPQTRLTEAGQFFTRSDRNGHVCNYGGFWTVTIVGKTRKTEENHELCWLDVPTAIASLRHDSHAWFLMTWLRWSQRSMSHYRRADAAKLFKALRQPKRPKPRRRGADKRS